jgi:serine/threonine protein kinase/tetratricopeptide (TPR) repeat protein
LIIRYNSNDLRRTRTLSLTPGTILGHYEILAPLGAGGMGEVYRARDPRLDRDVAVKVLPRDVTRDPQRLQRFQLEAKVAGGLNHPNILAIYDVGSHEGVPFVVTELLNGETLRASLTGARLSIRQAVDYGEQVARGLAAAHDKGVVHRDLKPGNLFVTKDGLVKILDFGLAKVMLHEHAAADMSQAASMITQTAPGTILGSTGYMSPEQVRGLKVDHRSDIFSLGAVLYEMVSGRRAFRGETPADTLSLILNHHPPRPETMDPGAPPELIRIIMRCLAKRPEERFQSARDLAFGLKELSSGQVTSRVGVPSKGGKRPAIAVLPFVNRSTDPEQEFFCDGVAEEIINALAHVEGLRVIARTSSFAFKGKNEDMREIGSRLAVETLLEGSVRRAGNRLRITSQLINVADGSHLWSEHYDRQLEDVFAIQDEIALAIVESLKVTLLHHERAAIVRRHTESVEAHSEYLRALHYWSSFTPEGFARSLQCVTRAIQLDPQFAAAYAFIGGWHLSQTYWGDVPPCESVEVAGSMAEKALTFDDADATACGALGVIRGMFEADAETGERLLKKSAALAPSNAQFSLSLGIFLSMRGRHKEAVEHIRLARRLDPLSPNTNIFSAGVLVECGLVDEGVGELEKLIALMPGHWLAHYELARAYHSQSRLEEARVMGEKAVELSAGMSVVLSRLACIYYTIGDTARGDEALSRLQKRSEEAYVAPSFIAWVHMARGEHDQAVGWLERARHAKDPWFCATRLYTQPFLTLNSPVDTFLTRAGW